MRVLLDTNVLVRANPKASGSARTLLKEITRSAEHVLILSPFLLEEVERVLTYPRLQAAWPLSWAEIQRYTAVLDELAEIVHPGPAPKFLPRLTTHLTASSTPAYSLLLPGRDLSKDWGRQKQEQKQSGVLSIRSQTRVPES